MIKQMWEEKKNIKLGQLISTAVQVNKKWDRMMIAVVKNKGLGEDSLRC